MAVLAGLNIYSIKCQPFCKLSFVHSCLTISYSEPLQRKHLLAYGLKIYLERKFACSWDGALFSV